MRGFCAHLVHVGVKTSQYKQEHLVLHSVFPSFLRPGHQGLVYQLELIAINLTFPFLLLPGLPTLLSLTGN